MCEKTRPLLIVALSGRALAQSAQRASWQPIVLDGFADIDTQQAASHCTRLGVPKGRFDTQELLTIIQALRPGKERLPMVYGAGFESNSEALECLSEQCVLYGNTPETVRVVNNPHKFFKLLAELVIPHPEVSFIPPADDEGWLMKRSAASGGGHVRSWSTGRRWSSEHYFQRRVPGAAMSVLFISHGTAFRIIGYNSQWTYAHDTDSRYSYAGAINRAALNSDQIIKLTRYVGRLSKDLALQGLNSLDFVLVQGEPAVLELNARPSASFELYDSEMPQGWLYWHIQACQGRLPRLQRPPTKQLKAHAIVYAPRTLSIVCDLHWPAWSADRPERGSLIGAGQPLCSVSAEGKNPHEVKMLLRKRKWSILESLYRPCRAA